MQCSSHSSSCCITSPNPTEPTHINNIKFHTPQSNPSFASYSCSCSSCSCWLCCLWCNTLIVLIANSRVLSTLVLLTYRSQSHYGTTPSIHSLAWKSSSFFILWFSSWSVFSLSWVLYHASIMLSLDHCWLFMLITLN